MRPKTTALPSDEIRGIFNRIAPVYDDLNQWLSLGQHRIWKLMTVKWTNPQPGDRGLDICCGSGDLALRLARAIGSSGSVTGVDFSTAQLAIAHQRSSTDHPHLTLDWIEGDALALPFADNTFDCATMGYGLRNVTDIPRCLQDIHRVLKPGATVAILDFHRPSWTLLDQFQRWYLSTMVVPLAQQFGLTDEYAYIAPSLDRFPTGPEQVQLALAAGFQGVIH
ncbi:MAG: bifunctional demethylmenaquinone methyltransferase/2-methoxy-6-polyprenyl-1,4-benzoquinol methylase UbiE, partial [Thermosynechococcaceae cyanobacterium]